MTGIDKITGKIIADSEIKAKEIEAAALIQIEEIKLRTEKEKESKISELKKQLEIDFIQKSRIYESRRDLKSRNALLETKQNLIEEVFSKAIEQICQLEATEYQKIVKKMLLEATETGTEEVLISQKDSSIITDDLIESINKELILSGKDGKIKLSKQYSDISGGFLLKNADININYSFESLLRSKRDALEPELAEILF